jgi:hypothetical protein
MEMFRRFGETYYLYLEGRKLRLYVRLKHFKPSIITQHHIPDEQPKETAYGVP